MSYTTKNPCKNIDLGKTVAGESGAFNKLAIKMFISMKAELQVIALKFGFSNFGCLLRICLLVVFSFSSM